MKNIKQISEQTGISKVSLYKLIRKPELKDHVIKEGNTTLIDDIGEQIIIEYYARQRLASLNDILDESTEKTQELEVKEELNHVNKHSLQDDNQVKDIEFMRILENQLNIKDEQIKESMRILENQLNAKDEQIQEKNNQMQTKDEQIRQKDNQLNALLIMLNKEKDIKLISDNIVADRTDTSPPETKGFFKKFFKKK